MSLKTWWQKLTKKQEPARVEPPAVTEARQRVEARFVDPLEERRRRRSAATVRGTVPRSDPGYLARQGYPQGPSRPPWQRDRDALRADQEALRADFAAADAAYWRDEADLAEREREAAEAVLEHTLLSQELDHGHHHHHHGYDQADDYNSHLREDAEADWSAAQTAAEPVDDRPILPNGAVDPTWTANPPQDTTPAPEPPRTDDQFYGRDADFYSGGGNSAPDPTPTPDYSSSSDTSPDYGSTSSDSFGSSTDY